MPSTHTKKLVPASACFKPPSCTPRTAPSLRASGLLSWKRTSSMAPSPASENHDTSAITASIDDGDGSAPFLLDGSKAVKLSFPMGSLRTCLIADTLPDSTKVFVTASENKIEIKTALSHISIVKKTRTEPWRVNSTHYNSEPDAVRAFLHGMRETGTTPPRAADSMHAIMEQTIPPLRGAGPPPDHTAPKHQNNHCQPGLCPHPCVVSLVNRPTQGTDYETTFAKPLIFKNKTN